MMRKKRHPPLVTSEKSYEWLWSAEQPMPAEKAGSPHWLVYVGVLLGGICSTFLVHVLARQWFLRRQWEDFRIEFQQQVDDL